jgi:AraC-like DNA-binding protein
MLIFNSREFHKANIAPKTVYDRYVVHFSPMLIFPLCTPEKHLLDCFDDRKIGEGNLRHTTPEQFRHMVGLFDKLFFSLHDFSIFSSVLALSTLLEILVALNVIYDKPVGEAPHIELSPEITSVINYISCNLNSDLSLETLAEIHFIDKYYLCRKFKSECGVTLHQHIVSKRLLFAKDLLSEGKGILEACVSAGFNDYSNFMRTFKKVIGITPMQYIQGYQCSTDNTN